MDKQQLIDWLHARNDAWEALIAEVGPERMELPGVNGDWTFKDMVAHVVGWQPVLTARLLAAQRGEPQPPNPLPVDTEDEDAVNAWIYETNRDRPVDEVLADGRRIVGELFAAIESLPDNIRIETHEERFHLVWVGDRRFHVAELFDHFDDDHEADVRAWLETLAK